jgi:alanyl-tRNA synthetase
LAQLWRWIGTSSLHPPSLPPPKLTSTPVPFQLWRLIGTPFTSFDLGDGHDALHLRLPQLLLALPLAIGAATSRVSTALAFLLLSEAALVWLPRCAAAAASLLAFYFWGLAGGGPSDSIIEVVEAVRITEMPPRLATAVDHFTVNLAVAGALLLLPAFGSGRFSIDALVKKRD